MYYLPFFLDTGFFTGIFDPDLPYIVISLYVLQERSFISSHLV